MFAAVFFVLLFFLPAAFTELNFLSGGGLRLRLQGQLQPLPTPVSA